jgi:hypothetical protein
MTAWVLMLLSLSPAAKSSPVEVEQRLGRAVCRLSIDRGEVELSGELRVLVSIEGPAPIEVDLPRPLTATTDWQVNVSPPKTVSLGEGVERWQQAFRFKPYQTGRVPLKLQPIRFRTGNEVRDWELTWPPQNIGVTSSVENADLGSARPVTDIEPLPPVEPSSHHWGLAATVAIVIILVIGVALWRLGRKGAKPQPARSPRDRALAELAKIDPPAPEQLPRVADVLRQFLEEHFQLAATRQTTSEFHTTLGNANVLTESQVESVAEILTRCDLVKFAGVRPDAETCEALLRRSRLLVAEAGQAAQALPPGSGQTPR